MGLESLRVLNISKTKVRTTHAEEFAAFQVESLLPGEFRLDSCQRVLWVCFDEDLKDVSIPRFVEVRAGVEAYFFLLRVATGLESQIVGETDIFGQLKEAWKKYAAENSRAGVQYWMQRVFEDTKEIRSAHMQHQGGASYGSLVRRMIRERVEQKPELANGKVLLVGAGQLAASVAPYLVEHEVLLMNRSREKLEALKSELSRLHSSKPVRILQNEEEDQDAWKTASFVVVCIPTDSVADAERIRALRPDALVIHLGCLRNQAGQWLEHGQFQCLDDLFELQKVQDEMRSLCITRAKKGCEERAKLRSLGSSLTIPHGWEDLAVFA